MRPLWQSAFLLSCYSVAARISHSSLEDPYAFPKYRVTYLNGLPVLKDTAERWLRHGLSGGEAEFLDHDWKAGSPRAAIGSGDDVDHQPDNLKPTLNLTLERMKLGPGSEYLCLIPPSPEQPLQASEGSQEETTPVQSWALLQPLSGKCLYHRQPWFTYSYCHNQDIRQFRELPHHVLSPAGHEPQEDPEWESYTLGRAPPTIEPGVELTIAQENVVAANLELAKGAGSRYLVQRWGDGTMCDKTGKHREVEVQFHCSMTSTDTIMLVREAKTCSYVLVIHTPRLCGEPGFKSRLESSDEAYIRCREVVDTIDSSANPDGPVREADFPINRAPTRQPLLTVPAPAVVDPKTAADAKPDGKDKLQAYNDRLRKTLKALMGANEGQGDQFPRVLVEQIDLGDGEEDLIFEIDLGDFPPEGDYDDDDSGLSILEALQAAGIDVREKENDKNKKKKDPRRDEL